MKKLLITLTFLILSLTFSPFYLFISETKLNDLPIIFLQQIKYER